MYSAKEKGQRLVYWVIDPFVSLLAKLGVTPNMITSFGFILNLLATVVFIYGAEKSNRFDFRFVGWAGAVILFAGVFDMLDGRLARKNGLSSDYGALYDSVIDRYSELFMFLGICYYLVSHDFFWSSIFAFIAMIGSIMVSYVRARAEGLGVSASVGIMQRPERILLIGISAILCGIMASVIGSEFKVQPDGFPIPVFETISIFTFPIFLLAIMSNWTAIRRLTYSKKMLDQDNIEN